jgi:2-dehydropantoate 2-reductase
LVWQIVLVFFSELLFSDSKFLGRALGFSDSPSGLPSSTVEVAIENTRVIHITPHSSHKPSMLLDVERGQPIEVEVIFGEIVRMARERKVDVPVSHFWIALLVGLVMTSDLKKAC